MRVFGPRSLVALIFAALFLPVSCGISSAETTLLVVIPELPAMLTSRFRPAEYRVRYLSADGSIGESVLPATVRRVAISIAKSGIVPVTAQVIVPGVTAPRLVCGGFSPVDDSRDGSLELSWKEGCLAGFLLDYFATTGNDPWFNLAKLREVVSETTGGNPWNLDLESLSVGFEWYALSRSAIRKARMCSFTGLLPSGSWRWVDPLASAPVDESFFAPTGVHALFDLSTEATAELFVGRDQWTFVLNRDPGTAVSGIW